jgi:uncharacterized phage protein (TIGR02218 family)
VTYAARETSQSSGQPFELYLFQTETQTWRLTSADRKITYNGQIYEPEAIVRTATGQGQETTSGSIKVTLPKEHAIALLFVSYIPGTPLSLVILRGHEGEPDAEVVTHFTGKVTMATFGEDCELTVVPERDVLKKRVPGPKYQKPCNHILYDSGCQVDKNLFKVTATLTNVTGETIQAAAFATKPDGWFNAGYIEKGTERRMIINHVGNTVTLLNAMAGLAVGDVITAYAGCNRSFSDCNTKFNNAPNFFGFEFIPGRNPFNGLE